MMISDENVPKYPSAQVSFVSSCSCSTNLNCPLPLLCEHHVQLLAEEWRDAFYSHACVLDYQRETEAPTSEPYDDYVRRLLSALCACPNGLRFSTVPFDVKESADYFTLRRLDPPYLRLASETSLQSDGQQQQQSQQQHAFAHSLSQLQPTLLDCLRFSPAKMNRDSLQSLFVLAQVWRALREYHSHGFLHGRLSLDTIHLREDCLIFLAPPDTSRLLERMRTPSSALSPGAISSEADSMAQEAGGEVNAEEALHQLPRALRAWLLGEMSNFDYLMYLNRLAARRMNDPLHHPILPWVVDFQSPEGEFRDLSKSMFRLNKGDKQLDLQYMPFDAGDSRRSSVVSLTGGPATQVPHHVTDFISDITYYSYKARQIPKEVLVRHVRPNWQPNEYPSTMRRLYKWTPDECIPEFFTDPNIFVSRHPDMRDLELPSWCPTAADFLRYHRAALESDRVSNQLNQWIDLTFGYKLAGVEAEQAKNVCLQLVDAHTDIRTSGVVQLFRVPHPRRLTPCRFFRPEHPLLTVANGPSGLQLPLDREEELTREGRRPSRSMGTAEAEETRPQVNRSLSAQERPFERTSVQDLFRHFNPETNPDAGSNVKHEISFPSDYDPLALLRHYEEYYRFVRITCKVDPEPFPDAVRPRVPDLVRAQHEDVLAFACLVIEVFAHPHVSPEQCRLGLDARIRVCQRVSQSCRGLIPRPFHSLLDLLEAWDPLKLPSLPVNACSVYAHVSFPAFFEPIHEMLLGMRASLARSDYVGCVDCLSAFLLRHGSRLSAEAFQQLITPQVVDLLCREGTRVAAAARLLVPLASLVGPTHTNRHLVPMLVLHVYGYEKPGTPNRDAGPNSVNGGERIPEPMPPQSQQLPPALRRLLRRHYGTLYHVSYMRQLIRVMSLRAFLAVIPQVLVHALSGARDLSPQEEERESEAGSGWGSGAGGSGNSPEPGSDYGSDADMEDRSDMEDEEDENGHENLAAAFRAEVTSVDSNDSFQPGGGAGGGEEPFEAVHINMDHYADVIDSASAGAGIAITSGRRRTELIPSEGRTGTRGGFTVGSAPSKIESLRTVDILTDPCQSSNGVSSRIDTRAYSTSMDSTCGSLLGPVSSLATEAVEWLADRLGPYLCSKFLVDNLLRMLVVCYADSDSLLPLEESCLPMPLNVANSHCQGDRSATKVLHCLRHIACLYGEHIILHQLRDFASNGIQQAIRSPGGGLMSVKVQAGLLASVVLLQQTATLLPDKELTANLEEPLLKEVYRALFVCSSLNTGFPDGARARKLIVTRLLDLLYALALRLGFENTRAKMAEVLKRFFAPFSNVFDSKGYDASGRDATGPVNTDEPIASSSPAQLAEHLGHSSFVEIRRDQRTKEFTLSTPVRRAHGHDSPNLSASNSPIVEPPQDELRTRMRLELAETFTLELAHLAYVTFSRLAGGLFLKQSLHNGELIFELYERQEVLRNAEVSSSNVAFNASLNSESQLLSADSSRHLKGNWLSYWEHEKGRNEVSKGWCLQQIPLMSFKGHTGAVRQLSVLNNEGNFISAGKDKMVRLWSIRNQGSGDHVETASFVYREHQKPICFTAYIPTMRLVASVADHAHLWDPYIGKDVRTFSSRNAFQCGALMPAPSPCLLTGEADGCVRLIDARQARFAERWYLGNSTGLGSAGMVGGTASAGALRHMAVSPNGWMVVCATTGSGGVAKLDIRSGIVSLAAVGLRAGDGPEVQLLRFMSANQLLVGAADQSLRVFDCASGAVAETALGIRREAVSQVVLEPHRDSVTALDLAPRGEVVLTTATKNFAVLNYDPESPVAPPYEPHKLNPAILKGTPSVLAMLPCNQLALIGSDSGGLVLLS